MRTFTRSYTIPTPFDDVDVLVTINGYEIEKIEPQFDKTETDEAKSDITAYINGNFDLCSEKIWTLIEEDNEDEFDPNSIFDIETDAMGNCFSDADPGL